MGVSFFFFFKFLFGAGFRKEGRNRRNWKIRGIEVHDVIFPNIPSSTAHVRPAFPHSLTSVTSSATDSAAL